MVPVFPRTIFDRLLMSGIGAEVWMQPGVDADNLRDHMAGFYRQTDPEGAVALVLGAGNINASRRSTRSTGCSRTARSCCSS